MFLNIYREKSEKYVWEWKIMPWDNDIRNIKLDRLNLIIQVY